LFAVREVLVNLSGHSFANFPLGETGRKEYSEIKENVHNSPEEQAAVAPPFERSALIQGRLRYFGQQMPRLARESDFSIAVNGRLRWCGRA